MVSLISRTLYRFIYAMIFLIVLAVGFYFYNPLLASDILLKINIWVHSKLYDRTVLVKGIKNITADSIRQAVPQEESNLSWLFNRGAFIDTLKKIPLIKNAEITSCTDEFFPQCYTIEIQERFPAFVSISQDSAILLDSDGQQLAIVPSAELFELLSKMLDPAAARPKIIVGIIAPELSSDQARARFVYAKQCFETIEKSSGINFSRIEVLANGEILAKPSKANFVVQFDDSWGHPEILQDEAKRLTLILNEIHARLEDVEKIDLAFNKLGVVKYRHPVVTPSKNTPTVHK